MKDSKTLNKNKPIGVFDSGMGGVSTLIELQKMLPNEKFCYYGDSGNAPYGPQSPENILAHSLRVTDFLIEKNVKAIVIACNTATSISANKLREKYPNIPIIGIEPAVKLGVDVGGKNILVMATATTIREDKFLNLVKKFDNAKISSIACPELVEIAEQNKLYDKKLCINQLNKYFSQFDMNEIDTIVLGCTHFIFYRQYIREILGYNQMIVDGNLGTANHLKYQLKSRDLLTDSKKSGEILFYNSDKSNSKLELSKKIFNDFK